MPRLRLPTRRRVLTRVILIVMDSVGHRRTARRAPLRRRGQRHARATSHKAVPLSVPTLRQLGLGACRARSVAPMCRRSARTAGWPRRRRGRTRSPGIGNGRSGARRRPFPTFPNGFSVRRASRSSSGGSAGGPWATSSASGTAIIDALRARAPADGRAHCLHVGRQRVPDRRARRRHSRRRAVPHLPRGVRHATRAAWAWRA